MGLAINILKHIALILKVIFYTSLTILSWGIGGILLESQNTHDPEYENDEYDLMRRREQMEKDV